jgi:hypothetical protein
MRGITFRPSGRLVTLLALLFLSACKKASGDFGEESGMEERADKADALMAMVPTIASIAIVPIFVFTFYFIVIFWDRRENRPSKDDAQLGTKLVLWGFILGGITGVLFGADQLITFVFSGFKGGFGAIKGALSGIVSGAVIAGAFGILFLPRTNNATQPQVERYAMGILGLGTGLAAIAALSALIQSVFFAKGWRTDIAPNLSHLAVFGAGAAFALLRHGKLSGWTEPVRPTLPSAPGGYPPAQGGGGYPPAQGGGYPPQGGGYPPQGGGYPPQGGGYPPQGGGYPPQGGGYPPQGGGYGR